MAFRRTAQGMNITANQALNRDFMAGLVLEDNVYRFASSVVGSPPYFEKAKKSALAMIRQKGTPHFFVTMSAAETHWPDLLRILSEVVDKKIITNEEADSLPFEVKSRLIRSDPVTCALYFNHKFRKVINTWKKTFDGPFSKYKILDIFFRIEFQHRGSPHVHMVLWLEDAPYLNPEDEDTIKAVIDFIDEICTTDTDHEDIQDVIYVQRHKCRKTCERRVRDKIVCRFDYPQMPMDKTCLLEPIHEEIMKNMSKDDQEKYRRIVKDAKEFLKKKTDITESFDEFLSKINCSHDEYVLALRSQLKHRKILLKRLPKNCNVNVYSKKVLLAMRSNMDIQYITDAYACIGYIVDYINKANRGLSRLLRQVVEDFNKGNYSLREKLKAISSVLFNSTEISAQEAAWIRLQMPMTSSSTVVEFIHSGPIKNRHKMLKSNDELRALDENSTEILKKGPIDRYPLRPSVLSDCCLAKFIAYFNFIGKGKKKIYVLI